jgi:SAM-dependent methyltransferase
MPDLDWNRRTWSQDYDWKFSGEEWSEAWGTSEAQWFGSIFPRLHRFLPTGCVLEIAPGFGRWTKYILPLCNQYLAIDLSDVCVAACEGKFNHVKHASFLKNDGLSLMAAADGQYDLVYSFDALVHVEMDVIGAYVSQSIAKLRPQGVGFLHHSNLQEFNGSIGEPGFRAQSVSGGLVAECVKQNHGKVLIQEIINWGGDHLHDCLTLFARKDSEWPNEPIFLRNSRFNEEARLIRDFQSYYSIAPAGSLGIPR